MQITIIVTSPLSVCGRKLVKGGKIVFITVQQHPVMVSTSSTSNNDAEYQLKMRLIDEMHHPCIYDKGHKDHFRRDKKLEVFGTIGTLLNLNGKPLM